MIAFLASLAGMLRLNVRIILDNMRQTFPTMTAMLVQDCLFFAAWIVFFDAFGTVRGWGLREIVLLYGINFASFGLLHLAADGFRYLGQQVQDGRVDLYITRPCPPLLSIKFANVNPSNLGDAVCGVLFLACGAGLDKADFLLAIVAALVVGVLFEATQVIYRSLIFFVPRSSSLTEYLTEALYYLTTVPQEGQGLLMRGLMFTVLPAAFMVTVPVQLIREASWLKLVELTAVTGLYSLFAAWLFKQGLKRYRMAG